MRPRKDIQRREFLTRTCELGKLGLVGLAATGLPARVALAKLGHENETAGQGGRGIMLDKVTVSVFAEHVGSQFRVHGESVGSLTVELIEATELQPTSGAPLVRKPFCTLFRGPVAPVLQQKIYTLEHATLGKLELFLVPVGRSTDGIEYEAVFN